MAATSSSSASPTASGSGAIGIGSLFGMMISTGLNAYSTYQAQRAQGDYQKEMFRLNALMAEFQAEDIIAQGAEEAGNIKRIGEEKVSFIRRRGKQTVGAQRAALAAQGVDITGGSPKEVIEETELMSEIDQEKVRNVAALDALTVKNNAWRQAWGLKTQSMNYLTEGKYAELTAKSASRQTLLTGGMNALNYGLQAWDKYNTYYPSKKKDVREENKKPDVNVAKILKRRTVI